MEELRDELNRLIDEEGLLSESTLFISQELDKLIVSHYQQNSFSYAL